MNPALEGHRQPCLAGESTESGIELGEQGLDEVRAAEFSGRLEFVGDTGTDEGGHGFIERLAEFDGLEVLGFVVDAGQGEGFSEAGDGSKQWHPIDPAGKGALPIRRRRKQELPVRRAGIFRNHPITGEDR